ncbi:MAG TPA: molybdopterin-dependent oxidoreductase [Acidimicrobiia bacterium]|nr:molybdopterin-dependent oxidoreductase [Acidimicrobiia bacterium]
MPINGRQLEVSPRHETAVDVLRNELGLTGTKLVCGTGVCGACTIAVDGVPVASCVLPAGDLEAGDVVTIEGIAADGELHPVQKGFLAHDALQCGYCTPGFVVEAVAFYSRWRAERGMARPERQDIARALAGHLCRCGAYQGIYRAVADACAGAFDAGEVAAVRPDGEAKVTGAARYTTDIHVDAMVGRIIRSEVAHGTLVGVDAEGALTLDGVEAFLMLAKPSERIRFYGQPVAAVVANDETTARLAADRVAVVIEPLPSAVGADECQADDAPDVHGWWIPPSNNEAPTLPNVRRKNLVGPTIPAAPFSWRVDRRLARAGDDGRLIEGRWDTAVVSHTALEPHAAVAEWSPDGHLTVHLSTQGVGPNREELAEQLGVPLENVEVVAVHVGGAFGAKQSLGVEAVAAARLARLASRPVRVVFDRIEEMTVGGNRPGTSIDLAIGADNSHRLTAMKVRSVADSGASAGSLVASFLPRFVYPGAPRSLLDFDAVSNAPPGTAFRAPGGPPALFALEGAVEELAEKIGVAPIALRRSWNRRPLRKAMYDWVEGHPLWSTRVAPGGGRHRRGVGVAFGSWFQGHDPTAEVTVEAGPGGIRVVAGVQDLGNGTRAMLASAVAESFGVAAASIDVVIGGSRHGRGFMSSGSRTTSSLWPTARAAADQAAKSLAEQLPAVGLEGATVTDGGVLHADELLTWDELLPRLSRVVEKATRPPDHRALTRLPHRIGGLRFGRGLPESAHVVEVEVDIRLGSVRVLRVDTALAAGKIHAPEVARSQVYGGVCQGLGMALHEERRIDRLTGAVLTTNLEDYRLAGIGDTPEMQVHFIEWGFEHAAGGGTGLAELGIVAVPAAIAGAVAHATGVRFRRLPILPGEIVEAFG